MFNTLFSFASLIASSFISNPVTELDFNSFAMAIDIAPLPLPISKILGSSISLISCIHCSTKISVSGLGINTFSLTLKGSP